MYYKLGISLLFIYCRHLTFAQRQSIPSFHLLWCIDSCCFPGSWFCAKLMGFFLPLHVFFSLIAWLNFPFLKTRSSYAVNLLPAGTGPTSHLKSHILQSFSVQQLMPRTSPHPQDRKPAGCYFPLPFSQFYSGFSEMNDSHFGRIKTEQARYMEGLGKEDRSSGKAQSSILNMTKQAR